LLSRGIALRVKDFRLLLSLLLVERQVSWLVMGLGGHWETDGLASGR
jgi:hypothetical protein